MLACENRESSTNVNTDCGGFSIRNRFYNFSSDKFKQALGVFRQDDEALEFARGYLGLLHSHTISIRLVSF